MGQSKRRWHPSGRLSWASIASVPMTASSTSVATHSWQRRWSHACGRNSASTSRSTRCFRAPTVAGLAEYIEATRNGGVTRESRPIEPTPHGGPLPLSFSQEALWFLDQLTPGQPTFNVTAALRINGPLDYRAWNGASTS